MLEAARAFIERTTPSRSSAPVIFRRKFSVLPLMVWPRPWVSDRALLRILLPARIRPLVRVWFGSRAGKEAASGWRDRESPCGPHRLIFRRMSIDSQGLPED